MLFCCRFNDREQSRTHPGTPVQQRGEDVGEASSDLMPAGRLFQSPACFVQGRRPTRLGPSDVLRTRLDGTCAVFCQSGRQGCVLLGDVSGRLGDHCSWKLVADRPARSRHQRVAAGAVSTTVLEDPSGAACMPGGVWPCGLSAGAPPEPVSKGPVRPWGCICPSWER